MKINPEQLDDTIREQLPCQIGDALYVIRKHNGKSNIDVGYVDSFSYNGSLAIHMHLYNEDLYVTYGIYGFGKEMHFTRKEAKAALQKVNDNN